MLNSSDKHGFIWGTSISAAQTESAVDADGKGPSIWDEFCNTRKGFVVKRSPVKNADHIKDSADFYYHYEEDIKLLKSLNFKHFRFSISWPRVMPDGRTPNEAGMDFYRRLVDTCLANGIEPWVTLYHWDLPLALQKEGGWSNRKVIDDFLRYTEYCVSSLKDVKHWIVLNEPSVFLGAGYLFAIHAPGLRHLGGFLAASHHALLCIAKASELIHSMNDRNQVGSSFSFTQIQEAGHSAKDIKAANIADTLINRFHFEPVIGLGYPETGLRMMQGINKFILPGDLQQIKADMDFIGIQTYTREVFKHSPFNPLLKIRHVPAKERSLLLTSMDWEIHPESIHHCISKVHAYNTGLPIYITENGAAFDDTLILNRVHDVERLDYLKSHIQEVLRARNEGMNVKGYFVWSLIDNFEWAEGYSPRFGLIHVDFKTKSRVLKDSALWFRSFLKDRH